MDRINDHIIEQIIAFYLGEISDKDKKELEAWVNEFKENEDDFKQILRKCQHLRLGLLEERAIVMKARIMEEWRKRERLKYRHRVLRLVSCVAILVLGIVMGCVYYESRNFESKKLEQEISLLNAKQGERVAVLQLASGEKWILKEQDERELEIGDGVVLKKDSIQGTRNFVNPEDTITENTYNTVMVPRGGEYKLVLPDGTIVWLNAESSLRFPTSFTDNERKVYAKGELYFDVKHDEVKPFIVDVERGYTIRVLGTEFNLRAYDDSPVVTTLVEGCVQVWSASDSVLLSPGQQALEMSGNHGIEVLDVDVVPYVAWHEGKFHFVRTPLKDIMEELARWYDVEVVFENPTVREECFTIEMQRFDDFNKVLRLIERTGMVTISVEAHTVTIK